MTAPHNGKIRILHPTSAEAMVRGCLMQFDRYAYEVYCERDGWQGFDGVIAAARVCPKCNKPLHEVEK